MSLKSSQNESSLLYSQAKNLFEKAKIAIDDGSIRTETQLVHEVFQAFNAFFESVGQPNLEVRYAPEGGPPWSEDYNDMMDEIKADLEMLFAEVELIGQTLYTDFNHNTVQYDTLNTRYNDILDKMKDLELYSGVTHSAIQYGNDDFLNSDKIDFSRSSLAAADISNGVASLPIKSKVNVSPDSQVSIITGNTEVGQYIIGSTSNGFPGNNTEIHTVTDGILTTQKYTPTFVGDQNNHGNYASMIDDNANTWFEYERISIREHDKVNVAKNLGWNYQVNGSTKIEYVGEPKNGVLKLQVQVVLPEEKVINQIFLNMYTPPNYGAKTAKVKDILVTDGRVPPYTILSDTYNGEGYNFNFDPVNAKVVYIVFEQPEKYATDIGHIYYEKTSATQRTGDYALGNEINATKYAQRVDGPAISLSSLGVEVELNSTKISANYPLLASGNYETTPMSNIINELSTNIEDKDTDIGIEKFEGWRWCIGVRDIEIYACEYEDEGEIVSKPFAFDKPIEKISLKADEILPASILNNFETKYDYIKYYVSIDDGGTWNPITPLDHEIVSEDQPPKIYTVRTLGTDSMKLTNKAAYLESETPVYNLRMKVVIKKPETVSMFAIETKDNLRDRTSPVLDSYTLNVVTEGNVFDSEKSYRIINATEINISAGEGETKPDIPKPDDTEPGNPPGLNPEDPECDKTDPTSDCYVDPNDPDNCDPDDPDSPCYAPPDDEGESSGGSDKLRISIDDNPAPRKRFCLGETEIITGPYSGDNNIDRLELYFNGILIEVTEIFNVFGPTKGGSFSYTITSEMLEQYFTATAKGHNFDLYVYVYDVEGNKRRAHMTSKFIDCEAEDTTLQKLSITVEEMNKKLCYCNDLHIKGYAKSTLLIDPNNIRLEINNQMVDFKNLGTPVNDPCTPEVESDTGVGEPEITPEPHVPTEEMEDLIGTAVFVINPMQTEDRNDFCVQETSGDHVYPIRIMMNHPLKKIQIRVNGAAALEETYSFDEMVFDTIYSVRLPEAADGKNYDVTIVGESYLGYEDRKTGFSFETRELKAKVSSACEDPMIGLSGDYGIYPSSFYDLSNSQYMIPYYATFEAFENQKGLSFARIGSQEETAFLAMATSHNDGRVPFDITIPYWKLLELGCTPKGKYKVKIYASDSAQEKSKSYTITMSDCVGDPRDTDNDIEWTKEEVSCLVCKCNDLIVKGHMTSLDEIQNIQLLINGIELDPKNLGQPANDPCGTVNALSTTENLTFNIMSETLNQSVVDYRIPYWKLLELGCVPGGKYKVKIIGTTAKDKTTNIYNFRVSENCTESTVEAGDCSVCENSDCAEEDEGGTIKIDVTTITNKPCECEDVFIVGNVSSTNKRINEVELRINDVEINPYDLGDVFPSKCSGDVPTTPTEPTSPEEATPTTPPAPGDSSAYVTFTNQSHTVICNSDNSFSVKVNIDSPDPLVSMKYKLTNNGKIITEQPVGGVAGIYGGSIQVGLPEYGIQMNGGAHTVKGYFEAGTAILEVTVTTSARTETSSLTIDVQDCLNINSNKNYNNNINEPNIDISFLNGSSAVNTSYWYGVHQPYINISDNFWEGRNDWLTIMGANNAKVDTSDPFWNQLYRLLKENILTGQLVLPEPFSRFEAWWKNNMSKFRTNSYKDRAMRGTVYATYKMSQIVIIHASSEKEVKILEDGRIDEIGTFIKMVPTYTYHWVDFKDVQSNSNVLAWVQSAEDDFLAYANIEESIFDGGVFSLNAYRHKNYTVSKNQDFGEAMIYDNVGTEYNVHHDLIGDSTFERLIFTEEKGVGLLVGGETIVHEVGHAVDYYAVDAYPDKYAGQSRAFHDWDEWRNISGWTLYTNAAQDAINIPYSDSNGNATAKFTKTSSTTYKLSTGKEAPVSPYGCRHPAEDFAEAYCIYKINPTLLRNLYPQKYAFMEQWIKNMPRNTDRVTVFNALNNKTLVLKDGVEIKPTCSCNMKTEKEDRAKELNQYEILPADTFHAFSWKIPYWKLLQIGCELGKSYPVRITAYAEDGEKKKTYKKTLSLKDCTTPPDEPPYEDACHVTESVIIHYYHATEEVVKEEVIPVSLLPYQIDNGAGSIARICLRDSGSKGVSVEIIESGDESGYAFQLWAAGVNYYQFGELNDMRTVWAESVYSKTKVTNPDLMLGKPNKTNTWLTDIQIGMYETAPSLNELGSAIYFNMPKAYKKYKCKDNIECGKRVRPKPTGKSCNEITHFLVQYYSVQSKGLRLTKIPISHKSSNKAEYKLDENTTIKAIWKKDLQGVAIQVIKASDNKSVMVTAVGVMYTDPEGYGHTEWSKTLRYYSDLAQNPDFVLGTSKKLSALTWISNGVIDYSRASYIGGVGDYIVVKIDEQVTKNLCNTPTQPPIDIPPEKLAPTINIDDEKICQDEGTQNIIINIKDQTGVAYAIYSVTVNDIQVIANRVKVEFDGGKQQQIMCPIDSSMFYAGDVIKIVVEAVNTLSGSVEKIETRTVEYCDSTPPEVIDFSVDLPPDSSGMYCYGQLEGDTMIPVNIHAIDDRAIGSYTISVDGEFATGETFDTSLFITDTDGLTTKVPLSLPDKVTEVNTTINHMTKADIVFIFDTSSSMSNEIENVRTNLERFKQSLINQGINAYFGYTDSNFNFDADDCYMPLTPSSSFNLNGVDRNTTAWEGLAWKQFTDTTHGGMRFLNQFRPGAQRIFIAVTDATINGTLTEAIISQMTDNDITVHFVNKQTHANNTKYNTLMSRTGGQRFNIDSSDFATQMDALATTIIEDTASFYPDKEYVVTIEVKDLSGNSSVEELRFTLTDCTKDQDTNDDVSEDEVNIKNDYTLLIRSKWGATPADLDIYIFLEKDVNQRFYYGDGNSKIDIEEYASLKSYKEFLSEDGSLRGKMYLNADYVSHSSDEDFDDKYEIVTIDGFPNTTMTVMLNSLGEVTSETLKAPRVEIVDGRTGLVVATFEKSVSEWSGKRYMRVCDIITDENGHFKEIGRGPAFLESFFPTL